MALSMYEDNVTLPKQLEAMVAHECINVNIMFDTVKWSTRPQEFSKGVDVEALEAYQRQPPRLTSKELQLLGKGAVSRIRDLLTKQGFIGVSTNGAFSTTYVEIIGSSRLMEPSKATPYYFSLSYARTRDAADHCTDDMPVVLREEVDKALEFVHAHWVGSGEQEWGVWFDRLANRQYPHAQDTWSAAATLQYMAAPVLVLPPILGGSNYLQTPIFSTYHEFDKLVETCHAVLHTATDKKIDTCASLVHCLGLQRCWPRLEIRLAQVALGMYTTPTLYSALVNTHLALLAATYCISRQIACRLEESANGSATAGDDLDLLLERWSTAVSKYATSSLDFMHRAQVDVQDLLTEFPFVELSVEQLTQGAHGLLDTVEYLQINVLQNILVLGDYKPEYHGIPAQLYEHYRQCKDFDVDLHAASTALQAIEKRFKRDYLDMRVLHDLSESLTIEKLNEPNVFADVDKAIAALTLMDPILAASIISMQQSAAEGVHQLLGILDAFRPSHVLSAMTTWHVERGFWEDPARPSFDSELELRPAVWWIGQCIRVKQREEVVCGIMQQFTLGLDIGPVRALFLEKFLGHMCL